MNLGIIITGTEHGAAIKLVSDEIQQDLVFTGVIAGQNGEILFSHKGEPIYRVNLPTNNVRRIFNYIRHKESCETF